MPMLKTLFAALALTALINCGPSSPIAGSAEAQQALPRAGQYRLDPHHASVVFRARHLGLSRTVGRFNTIAAELTLDPEAPERSTLSATIDVASVDTGLPSFDNFLRGRSFFNVTANPQISFVGRTIQRTAETTARVTGDLTLNGQTHPLTLDVTFNGAGENPFERTYLTGFSATGLISRSQFGLSALPQAVGDEIEILIEAEFVFAV